MTRDEAKAYFEKVIATETAVDTREAAALAIEALAQPKFVALREGEVAILEFDRPIKAETSDRIREQWQALTGTDAVILDAGARLAGKVGPS